MGAPPSAAGKPKPYAEVVTKDAKSDLTGLFKTHQVDDKYYFEIPKSALNKELMWVTTLERSSAFYGFGQTEVQDRVIRFEKRGDKLLLRGVSFRYRAEEAHGDVKRSLEKGNIEPILGVYNVAAYGEGESMVIDASPLIYSSLFGASFDSSRSFIESIKSFPENVLVKVTGTRAGGGGGITLGPGGPVPSAGGGGAETIVINHNIVRLPEKPMMPRYADSRVGWFSTTYTELGGTENKVKDVTIIDRWRLEKKDPTAKLSEPVKPIVYYLGSEIPTKWKPYIKKGIEAWNGAFEKAGFKNAVQCREIPSKEEDPEFDDEDIRYTVVRWLPSGVENAYGPHLSDPRTGEILNGSPKIFHNILSLIQNWYFVQASHSDPRARKLPFPEDLTGELLAYVVTHEVGHTLGFPHNMKASSSVPVKNLRDPKWTAQWGTTPSIMDYARNNYVAQPEDKVTQLMPKIGVYDHFAVEWGYSIFPVSSPEAEKPFLNAIANRQLTNPMLRFGDPSGDDPGRQTEDLSADGVEATRLGMKNLERTLGWLSSATLKPGEDFSDLEKMYSEILGQRSLELGHVLTIIGGVTETEYHAGQSSNPNYTPVEKARQKAAVQLFNDLVFKTSPLLVRPEITGKTSATGTIDRVLGEQRGILNGILRENRLNRLVEFEVTNPATAYTVSELLTDLKNGIFSEFGASGKGTTDLYRRNLQRAFVDTLVTKLGPPPAPPTLPAGLPPDVARRARASFQPLSGEAKAQVRGALADIQQLLAGAKGRATDRATQLHLTDLLKTIDLALNPKF